MVTFVLDSSAILRFLEGEAGAERVKERLRKASLGECPLEVSAVNWGEVIGITAKRQGREKAETLRNRLERYGLHVIPATAERAFRSALLKLTLGLSYADAFYVELASGSSETVLVTADFSMKVAKGEVQVEFLPVKPTS